MPELLKAKHASLPGVSAMKEVPLNEDLCFFRYRSAAGVSTCGL